MKKNIRHCEDCGDEVEGRRVYCKNCGRLVCGWCYYHIHRDAEKICKPINDGAPPYTTEELDIITNPRFISAAEHSVHLTGLESPQKCTTEKLCPVHNRWHAPVPPRK